MKHETINVIKDLFVEARIALPRLRHVRDGPRRQALGLGHADDD